jgi:hypothetical protein
VRARARLTGTAGNVALVFWCWLAIGKNPCHSLTPGFAKLNSTNQSHFAYSPQGAIALVHLYAQGFGCSSAISYKSQGTQLGHESASLFSVVIGDTCRIVKGRCVTKDAPEHEIQIWHFQNSRFHGYSLFVPCTSDNSSLVVWCWVEYDHMPFRENAVDKAISYQEPKTKSRNKLPLLLVSAFLPRIRQSIN